MIFHLSIPADDPKRTAQLFAELWGGRVFPFPMVGRGSFVANAGDGTGTTCEVYPRGLALHPGETMVEERPGECARNTPFHVAVGTKLSPEEVHALADRHGVRSIRCRRGPFELIELWIDDCFMVEVLTEEMQADYLKAARHESWEAMLARMGVPATA